MHSYQTIDEYISASPDSIQPQLSQIRAVIRSVAPGAIESIGYGIPTYKLKGKNLVHFAGYKTHLAFYPGPQAIEVFAKDLADYDTAKGTIRFELTKPVPCDLIKKITEYCLLQLQATHK